MSEKKYNQTTKDMMRQIFDCYSELSVKKLSCDGEASIAYMAQRYVQLNNDLETLFVELGREVSIDEIKEFEEKCPAFQVGRPN